MPLALAGAGILAVALVTLTVTPSAKGDMVNASWQGAAVPTAGTYPVRASTPAFAPPVLEDGLWGEDIWLPP